MEHKLCHISELEERKPIAFDLEGLEVGIIFSKGQVYAYENNCPHFGGPVCLGDVFSQIKLELNDQQMVVDEYTDENELRLVCPWHGFEYELKTGKCTIEPNLSLRKFHAYLKENYVYLQSEQNE
ncbi:Rieske 2Fe-2S domain-containing protein [Thalassobacillus sp. CUG 92003]|uniref:Rieske (2Fe-2S) protein n=1 Tax=Thalassobacillus sp. CUG 92003 TaxID=2736641 RepID=UPI0015E7BF57|nr:Rieske 2Fe-2S domain-containing protein [Thalassobacillus sp. CUG 92003]